MNTCGCAVVVVTAVTAWLSQPGPLRAAEISSHLEKGEKAFRVRDFDGALAAFRKAVETHPRSSHAHYFLGVALEKKARLEEAETAYRKAIALDAQLAEAHNNLGSLLLGRGLLAEAERCYAAAVRARPEYALAHFNLGVLYDTQGRRTEAVAAYRAAARANPDDVAIRLNLGAALRRAGDLEGALGEARAAVKLDDRNATAWTNLGLLLSDTGALEEAQQALVRATQIGTSYAPAWHALGRIELRRKDPVAARLALRRAVALQATDKGATVAARALYHEDLCRAEVGADPPGDRGMAACRKAVALDGARPATRYHLGKALAARGECAAARKEIERFASMPGVTEAAKAGAAELIAACGKKSP